MAEELQHFSHGCALTSPNIIAYGVCNICHKDELVEFCCKLCKFDLCKACSKLPQKVCHDFHSDHPLEFCLRQYDRKPSHIVCSSCGNMSSGSFYKCKECEIYLDLDCALMENIFRGWGVKEMLHYSHLHMLRRCRPGPDAEDSSCLLCDIPLSPSSICYGCVHCYLFVHESCLDCPSEIHHHPVHWEHPLRRTDYTQNCGGGKICNACGDKIVNGPFGCLECNFYLHLRCADSLLRGLLHKSHRHRLFYVATRARLVFSRGSPCQICRGSCMLSLDSFYQCVECRLNFHFECLGIPESVVNKSFHVHPLACTVYEADDNSLEYCGVCETVVHEGHHAYHCENCDYLGHIECVLRKEAPSPLYVKELYPCAEDATREADKGDCETNELENKLVVNDIDHIHIMRPDHMSELDELDCNMCDKNISGSPYKCESCSFQTHHFCAELGLPSIQRRHCNHPLTLMPKPDAHSMTKCDICKNKIIGFNLLCRICNTVIDISCALKAKHALGALGQKVIGTWEGRCIENHNLVQVMVSMSHPTACAICDEDMYGKVVSCMTCEEMYHSRCIGAREQVLRDHPLHYDHWLRFSLTGRSQCIVCKQYVTKYGFTCDTCELCFHVKCIEVATTSRTIEFHDHYLYNFWIDEPHLSRACNVCARPCGGSFYGCIVCNFNAHVQCIGFPTDVKSQRHQHIVMLKYYRGYETCSLCGFQGYGHMYTCNYCQVVFHAKCIMSMDAREAATEEEQLKEIYFMYLDGVLFNNLLRYSDSNRSFETMWRQRQGR